MTEIILTLAQYDHVVTLAEQRQAAKIAGTSKKYSKDSSDLEVTIKGMAAEYAFSLLLGLQPDFDAKTTGDQGVDFVLPNGVTIDAKFRGKQGQDFALHSDDIAEFKADLGVLLWPTKYQRSFKFVGWVKRETFAKRAKRIKLAGWRLVMPWQQMRDPNTLITHIEKLPPVPQPQQNDPQKPAPIYLRGAWIG